MVPVVTIEMVEALLDTLNERTPNLLSQSLLIGGWSALLYHTRLVEENNPEYPAPIPENPDRLQSRDVDFTNVWSGDFYEALPEFIVTPEKGPEYLEIFGVRLGFAQAPEAIDPVEAFENARWLQTRAGTKFAILDPLRLYRGKQALIQKGRRKANDSFHLEIATT